MLVLIYSSSGSLTFIDFVALPFFYITHTQIKIGTRTQNGTGSGIETEAATVRVDVIGMVLEVDDSRQHRLNPKTVDPVKGSKTSPPDLVQNVVKGLLTKMSPCLPHQCLHPPSQPQSLPTLTSHQ